MITQGMPISRNFKGKAQQIFPVIDMLAQRQGKATLGEYYRLCISNGGR